MGQGGMKGADPQLVLFLTPVCTADSSEKVTYRDRQGCAH